MLFGKDKKGTSGILMFNLNKDTQTNDDIDKQTGDIILNEKLKKRILKSTEKTPYEPSKRRKTKVIINLGGNDEQFNEFGQGPSGPFRI